MLRSLTISAALVLGTSATPKQAKVKPAIANNSSRPVVSVNAPSPNFDSQAEQQLLQLANEARKRAGAPVLHPDEGLTKAARSHAEVMARQGQLSHQFDGEPSLPSRLASNSTLRLDHAGENVALDITAGQAHQHLMLSPPHRENLLDASFNVAGFGVIRLGERLYVVQDFGHSLPPYTADQTEEAIVAAVARARRAEHLPALARKTESELRSAVCSMAEQDRLATTAMRRVAQHYNIVSYTNLHPEVLPASAVRLIGEQRFSNMAVNVCYGRTGTYPSGVYWVGLAFY
jgi:uncharacterized protein YkwD